MEKAQDYFRVENLLGYRRKQIADIRLTYGICLLYSHLHETRNSTLSAGGTVMSQKDHLRPMTRLCSSYARSKVNFVCHMPHPSNSVQNKLMHVHLFWTQFKHTRFTFQIIILNLYYALIKVTFWIALYISELYCVVIQRSFLSRFSLFCFLRKGYLTVWKFTLFKP